MRKILLAFLLLVLCLAACSAAPERITGFNDCGGWTSADWERASTQDKHDAALAFLVEYSGSTDETYRKLAAAPEDRQLAEQDELMQDVITAWFDQAEIGDTLSDLLVLTQQAAGKDTYAE